MNAAAIQYILRITADPYPSPDYRVCRTREQIRDYFTQSHNHPLIHYLGTDTESLPGGAPYCVTFSHTPGTGRLIYSHEKELLEELVFCYTAGNSEHEEEWLHLLFHNYLHDVVPMGVMFLPIGQFTDTMVRAYNLCLGGGGDDDDSSSKAGRGSLGLKQLSRRFLNMRMTSFKDTVFPWSIPHLTRYLEQGITVFSYQDRNIKKCQCGCLQERHLVKGAKGYNHGQCTACKGCDKYRAYKYPPLTEEDNKMNRLHRKVTGLVEAIRSGKCERDEEEGEVINPWVRIRGWHDYDRQYLVDCLGAIPVPNIAHVPEPELVKYAVCDADATLRLFLFLLTYWPWIYYQ